MATKKTGLGRGFDAIFADNAVEEISTSQSAVKLKLTEIEPNRNQPRKNFDEEALADLAHSIEQHGVLQPLLVNEPYLSLLFLIFVTKQIHTYHICSLKIIA